MGATTVSSDIPSTGGLEKSCEGMGRTTLSAIRAPPPTDCGPGLNGPNRTNPMWHDSKGFTFLPAPRGRPGRYAVRCGEFIWVMSTVIIPEFEKPVLPMHAITMKLDESRKMAGNKGEEECPRIEVHRLMMNGVDGGDLCGYADFPSFIAAGRKAIQTVQSLEDAIRVLQAYTFDNAELTPEDLVDLLKHKNSKLEDDLRALRKENVDLHQRLGAKEEELSKFRVRKNRSVVHAYRRVYKRNRRDLNQGAQKQEEEKSIDIKDSDDAQKLKAETADLKASHEKRIADVRAECVQDAALRDTQVASTELDAFTKSLVVDNGRAKLLDIPQGQLQQRRTKSLPIMHEKQNSVAQRTLQTETRVYGLESKV